MYCTNAWAKSFSDAPAGSTFADGNAYIFNEGTCEMPVVDTPDVEVEDVEEPEVSEAEEEVEEVEAPEPWTDGYYMYAGWKWEVPAKAAEHRFCVHAAETDAVCWEQDSTFTTRGSVNTVGSF